MIVSKGILEDVVQDVLLLAIQSFKRDNAKMPAAYWCKTLYYVAIARHRKEKEIPVDEIEIYLPSFPANQITRTAATEAFSLLQYLPELHRSVMLELIDGASIINISEDLVLPISKVMRLIDDARRWLSDGGIYLCQDGRARRARTNRHSDKALRNGTGMSLAMFPPPRQSEGVR